MKAFLKKRWWLLLVVLGIVAGAVWFWQTKTAAANAPVKTTTAQYKDIRKTLSFSGRIDAASRVRMHFAAAGKLVYLGAQEGDAVKKYQTLATLDQRSMQKTLEKQLSLYQTERWDFENAQDDRKDRTLPQEERREAEQDQFALNRSVLDVELQSIAVESSRLTSPIAGILVTSPVKTPGVNVSVTDYFEVVDPATLYFRVHVDEVDIDELKIGQPVEVRLDARPDQVLRATVDKIAYQSTETTSGTAFAVDLKFLDAVNISEQRVGMNGDADIMLAEAKQVLVLPISAVTYRDGRYFVNIKTDSGKPEERAVETGIETDSEIEIRSGVTENDQVVLP